MPYTNYIILDALFNIVIMELSKIVVDSSENGTNKNICIKSLLKKYDENKQLFREQKYYFTKDIDTNQKHRIELNNKTCGEIIKEYRLIEMNNKYLIDYLKTIRNKTIAHNDKQFGFGELKKYSKKAFTYQQLDNFINDIYSIVNNLNRSVFGISTVGTYYFRDELIWLKELIKNNKKRHRK